MITAVSDYLTNGHGNAHRGMYHFSENANALYQQCREKVAQFIQAPARSDSNPDPSPDPSPDSSPEIIFTKSATESINLVAHSLQYTIDSKSSICVTTMEHHANLLPWQALCQRTGARLNILPVKADGTLDTTSLDAFLADNCALFAVCHVSNVSGVENDVKSLCQSAKQYKVPVLVDGAQAVGHMPVDVSDIDCDYYVFSGHKMYATTGIGVLYSKYPAEKHLSPLLLGGGIVNKVTSQDHQLKPGVEQFEAGSANMVGIVALLAAIEFIDDIGWPALIAHQQVLAEVLLSSLKSMDTLDVLGNPSNNSAVVSFVHRQVHSHDVASIMALDNIAVRAGHHCAQPYLTALGYKHCVRISLGCYNHKADIDRLLQALDKVGQVFL